jgi:hypothetical protein
MEKQKDRTRSITPPPFSNWPRVVKELRINTHLTKTVFERPLLTMANEALDSNLDRYRRDTPSIHTLVELALLAKLLGRQEDYRRIIAVIEPTKPEDMQNTLLDTKREELVDVARIFRLLDSQDLKGLGDYLKTFECRDKKGHYNFTQRGPHIGMLMGISAWAAGSQKMVHALYEHIYGKFDPGMAGTFAFMDGDPEGIEKQFRKLEKASLIGIDSKGRIDTLGLMRGDAINAAIFVALLAGADLRHPSNP